MNENNEVQPKNLREFVESVRMSEDEIQKESDRIDQLHD